MTQYLYVDLLLSFFGVFLYILGLKKFYLMNPKIISIKIKWTKKGWPIDIGIKRISTLKDEGLIADKIVYDSKKLLLQSETEIFLKKTLDLNYFKKNSFLAIKIWVR